MSSQKFLFIILMLLWAVPSFAAPESTVLNKEQHIYPLENHFSYFLDDSGKMKLSDILDPATQKQFIDSTEKPLNVGVTDSACWVRFQINNPQLTPREVVLELGTSTINTATLFIPAAENRFTRKTTGDKHPISERDFFHRRPCFSITIPPDSADTYYLRLKTNAILETSLTITDQKDFLNRLPVEYLLLGMFYASFIVAIAYNLFLYFSLRDTSRLLYVLYASVFCSLWVFIDGFWHQFGMAELTFDQLLGARVTNAGTCMTMALFTSWFFNCRKNAPRLHWLFMFIAIWGAVNIVMVCILPLAEYKAPVRLSWVVLIPSVIFTAILFMKRGFMRARYFLTAWLFVLIGAAVIFMDMYLNLFANTVITRYAWRLASVFEIIMLSLALADRINELDRDKNIAQARAFEAERKLKEELEKTVAERTRDLARRSTELEIANRKLEKLSQLDELTSLFNRRYFDSTLKNEWDRMKRSGGSLCLIMLDIDHFKEYNDTYGHPTGDLCLQSVAQTLKTGALRSSDVCARYGGEEFALILPATDIEGGRVIAENLRLQIMNKQIPHITETGFITISLGISAAVPGNDNSPDSLLEKADQALYKSKQDGRNRVTVL